jgi:hypothetical protein
MQASIKITMFVGAAILSAARPAGATPAEDLGNQMEAYANIEANLGDNTSPETLADARKTYGKDCDALVAKAKKQLKKPDAEIIGYRLNDHPNARKVGDKFAVKVADAAWFCDRYRTRLDELALRFMVDESKGYEVTVKAGFTEDQRNDLRSGGQDARKRGADCTAITALMTKRGTAADFAIKTPRNEVKLSDMPAVCAMFGTYADLRDTEWKAVSKKFEKPFTDAGITGDRLSWFVYYGPGIEVWYLPGCKGETSLAKIKKAPVLFQWLTGNDGITIRRFQFKGDKLVSQTDKQYLTEAGAYTGCR